MKNSTVEQFMASNTFDQEYKYDKSLWFVPSFSGLYLAMIEVAIILGTAYYFRNYNLHCMKASKKMNNFTYYWFVFTMFTGFVWESSFVAQYRDVNKYSQYLINNNQTVWTNNYPLNYLLPWEFSKIFYADYGAYADREYMTNTNDWSRVIESTHAIMCATFALFAFLFGYFNKNNRMSVCIGAAMGTQLMNSVLYMAEYVVQLDDPDNVNYPTDRFPSGTLLVDRPFMWVNVFWTAFPLYILVVELVFKNGINPIEYVSYKTGFKQKTPLIRKNDDNVVFEGLETDLKFGIETRASRKKRLNVDTENEYEK